MHVDLTPLDLDLTLYAGDPQAVVFNIVDKVTGVPLDLSDRVWGASWRRTRSAATAVPLSVDDSGASGGTVIVHFPADLAPIGVYDIQGVHGITGADTIVTGTVTVEPDVTRP